MFSKTCENAIRALIYLSAASSKDCKISIIDLSINIEAPKHYTAKNLQKLVQENIVSSQKGVNGGFYLTKTQNKIKLIKIIFLIDGDKLFTGCGLGLKYCSEKEPCSLHEKFKVIRNGINEMLQNTVIEELAKSFREGKGFLRSTRPIA